MFSNGQERQTILSIATKTWSRDSHGLYDYESTQAKTAMNIFTDNAYLVRRKLEIRQISSLEEMKEDELLLETKCEKVSERYSLSHAVPISVEPTEKNINELQNKIWYVIKHDDSSTNNPNNQTVNNRNEDYYICLNDIVKLGRVKYAANEIVIIKGQDEMDVDLEVDQKINPYNISLVNYGTKPVFDFIYKTCTPPAAHLDETTCKYCLSGGSDDENPLVELCRCTGGIKYSHYFCLKMWMNTKLSKKENEKQTVTSYNIKAFNCEICKTPYPCKIVFLIILFFIQFSIFLVRFIVNSNSNKIYDLIEILRPVNQNYIILESLNQLKDNNNLKSIHVITLQDQKITLGRGHESDVRINDISVSRTHAVLIFNPHNGKICIRDLKSKFGTLSLVKGNLQVKEKKIHLQIGRTYVEALTISSKDYERIKNKQR